MSVESEIIRATYSGNGVTTNFSFPYAFLDATDIDVYLVTVATGAEAVQAFVTDYDVIGLFDPLTNEYSDFSAGASINFVVAPSSAYTVVIIRNNPTTQDVDLVSSSAYLPAPIEYILDKIVMMVQFLTERSTRSVRLSDASTSAIDLRLPVIEADSLLATNEAGDGLELVSIAGLIDMIEEGETVPMTADRAVITDGAGSLDVSATTSTELGYVSGVTSAIQTQLNAKLTSADPVPLNKGGTNNGSFAGTAGGVPYTDGSKMVNVGAGVSGYVLTSQGASPPQWLAAANNVAIWTGTHANATDYTANGTSSYTDLAVVSGTPVFTETLNLNMGTVTSTLDGGSKKIPGIIFTPPATGLWKVTAQCCIQPQNVGEVSFVALCDGSNTVIAEGEVNNPGTEPVVGQTLVGIFNIASLASPTTAKLRAATSNAATTNLIGFKLNSGPNVYWIIEPVAKY